VQNASSQPNPPPQARPNFLDDPKFHKMVLAIIILILGYLGFDLKQHDDVEPTPNPVIDDSGRLTQPLDDDGLPPLVMLTIPPIAKITGPSAGEVGNFLILDAGESVGDFYAWDCDRQLPGGVSIMPMKDDNGKHTRCQVASVAGVYRVTLGVSNEKGISMASWVVTVRGPPAPDCPPCPDPGPKPDPGPNPDPGPKPDPVPPLSDIAKEVLSIMQNSGEAPEKTRAVAGALRALLVEAQTGGWDAKQLNAEFKTRFLAVVGTSTDAKKKWGEYMQWQAAALKPLTEAAALRDAFLQIAIGLEGVK
jgi:hypothetical protein